MAQDFDLSINGLPVQVLNGRYIDTADTGAGGFTASILCDSEKEPFLFESIKPYKYSPVELYIDGELALTGKLTKTTPRKTETSTVYDLEGFSNTFNFLDSELAPPYEILNKTIHSLAIIVGRQTGTNIVHTGPDGNKFDKATVQRGQTGFDFIKPLARQRNHVISTTPEGDLLLYQPTVTGATVGTIEEDSPGSLLQQEFTAEFDGRKRFRTFKAVSQTPKGTAQAVATDKNIDQPRHKIFEANDQIAGAIKETAEFQKNQSLINALTQQITVIGWTAPDGSPFKSNTLITIKSKTLFVPDGFTFFIRQVDKILTGSTKTAVLHLVPPNIYTDKEVVEPWFE